MTETAAEKRVRTAFAHMIDIQHPVALALETTRQSVVDEAEKHARATVELVRKELEEAGFDLEICAPYPRSGYSDYFSKLAKYRQFSSLTKWRKVTYHLNEPHYADVDAALVEKFVLNAQKDAAQQYDAFIVKLCGKIGDCAAAKIDRPYSLWNYSHLTVQKMDGDREFTEIWRSQMIVNVSKHGRLFNQWPSRKVKNYA